VLDSEAKVSIVGCQLSELEDLGAEWGGRGGRWSGQLLRWRGHVIGRPLPRPGACWCRVLQSRLCSRRQGAGHTAEGKQGQGDSAIVVGLVLQVGVGER
jgi:hypothetical protein